MTLRLKYPEIEPHLTDFYKTDDGHEVYYEESGNPNGKPALFLHGGPGAGTSPGHRQYFDPKKYKIVLIDQRGSGKSKPFANLENNTTWKLIEDIENIRNLLKIEKWLVFGGSWGSTLALAYAQTHPAQVTELVLRGIFLCRPEDTRWFYQHGASEIYPDKWDDYLKVIPRSERGNLISAYYKRLCSSNEKEKFEAARAWSMWEGSTYKLIPSQDDLTDFSNDQFALSLARIECHYFMNNCFFDSDNHLLENCKKIAAIPMVIVHGRYDIICPIRQAWDLKKACPEADLKIIDDAGHAASEAGITHALLEATDHFSV